VRAQGERGGARGRVGLELESGSVGEEDGPDGQGPPGGETGRGRSALGRIGPGAGKRAGGKGKRKGRRDGLGWKGV